jgi:hypothetical protein
MRGRLWGAVEMETRREKKVKEGNNRKPRERLKIRENLE